MERSIRWGILGSGKIAHKFAEDLQQSEQGHLYAIASRTLSKAQEFSRKFSAQKALGSYEELIQDPKVDVLYIATPHPFHFQWSMKGLQNGKAILCEKPMGMNATQVERLIKVARQQKLFLMEGLWTRFIPGTQKLLEWIEEKPLGDLLFIRADFGFKAHKDPDSRIFNKSLGGGSLLDIGIYPIYLSLLTLGTPSASHAMARFTETEVDGYCSMLFDYESHAKAILESTIEANTPTEAFLYFEHGHIHMHSRFHHTEKLSLISPQGRESTYHIPYRGHGYIHEIEEVHHCLLSGKTESDLLPLSTSQELSKIMDQVRSVIGLEYST